MPARLHRVLETLRPTITRESLARFLLSLLLAFGLWAWVEATNDPEVQRTISNIAVLPRNLSPDLVVTSELPTITVRIQGAQSRIQAVESGSIQAHISLDNVDQPGIYTRRVRAEIPSRLRLIEIIPAEVTVQVDRLSERSVVPIEVVLPEELPPNIEVLATQVIPSVATVRGPEQRVQSVTRITAPVGITGQASSFEETVTLVPVDASGNSVPGVSVQPSAAKVSVQLRVRGQVRRVIPTLVGTDRLAPGYELAGPPTVMPSDEVVVEGPESALAAIPYVTTSPIDVTGWDQSRTIPNVPIDTSRLPTGVTVDPKVVTVVIEVRRAEETRSLQGLPIVALNVRPGTIVELSPSTIDLDLRGSSTTLSHLQPTDILAFVDVENADVGVYQLPVHVALPSGVQYERVHPPIIQVTVRSPATPVTTPASP